MAEWVQIPDGPSIPRWLTDPAAMKEKVLGWVVDWLVTGLWEATVSVVSWILALFQKAIIRPTQAAGASLVDAGTRIGDAAIDLAWALSEPLRAAAGSGPFGILVVAFLSGVVLVVVAYLVRGAWEFAKGVNPY